MPCPVLWLNVAKIRRNNFFMSANITDSPVSRAQGGLIEKVINACSQAVKMVKVSQAVCLVVADSGLTGVPDWCPSPAAGWLSPQGAGYRHRSVFPQPLRIRMRPWCSVCFQQLRTQARGEPCLSSGHLKAGLVSRESSCKNLRAGKEGERIFGRLSGQV